MILPNAAFSAGAISKKMNTLLRQTTDSWGFLPMTPEPRRELKTLGSDTLIFEHEGFLIRAQLTRYYNADPHGDKSMADTYAGGRLNLAVYTIEPQNYLVQYEIQMHVEMKAISADEHLDALLPALIEKAKERLWQRLADGRTDEQGSTLGLGTVDGRSLVFHARK